MTTDHAPCCAPLMTSDELATYLSLPLATLYAWRSRGEGPDAVRVGKYLRYRRAAVEAWLDAQAS